jgi:hypothetical protein
LDPSLPPQLQQATRATCLRDGHLIQTWPGFSETKLWTLILPTDAQEDPLSQRWGNHINKKKDHRINNTENEKPLRHHDLISESSITKNPSFSARQNNGVHSFMTTRRRSTTARPADPKTWQAKGSPRQHTNQIQQFK